MRFLQCWQCRGPWEKHGSETGGFFSCNRFDSKAKDKDEEAVKVGEDWLFVLLRVYSSAFLSWLLYSGLVGLFTFVYAVEASS